jgi:hypothetical protein
MPQSPGSMDQVINPNKSTSRRALSAFYPILAA